ncbi:ribose ABC transporter, periplasmic ribose-binding protein [Marinomonas sp. MED121]|uniref:substrate-binding domain-containing protein n=1 Tax=Marinomonas sp. MED121 TaxID=314277 RepID=UPI0000690D4C|nr:substrate-binding domain-containing protein [Marinomonas sp. MED121]EAQ65341.1 ribose ABC transporter, periplasmic ribose-binding protein [Marinomonas sp. MED121]
MYIRALGSFSKVFLLIIISISTCLNANELAESGLAKQLTEQEKLERFQLTVNDQAVPVDLKIQQPVRIAIIYPSADISDFWVRNYTAMTERLMELKLPFVIDQYSSRQIEHALQTQHTRAVLSSEKAYDFVIFGPSELALQSVNIQKLAASEQFKTFIWAFHTPNPRWEHQPDAWFDFSSAMGAEVLCHYVIERLGDNIEFAANRGIPGITDTQRSQGFIDCVEKKADWLNMYEHFGQYQKLGGSDGVKLFLSNFPEVKMVHNANTAMTIGALDTLVEESKLSDIFVTGWGGTAKEIEKIKMGELGATPMRMSDDLGVATAESIKFHIQKRESDIPHTYLGRIVVVHDKMTHEELDAFTKEAFRYSGIKQDE